MPHSYHTQEISSNIRGDALGALNRLCVFDSPNTLKPKAQSKIHTTQSIDPSKPDYCSAVSGRGLSTLKAKPTIKDTPGPSTIPGEGTPAVFLEAIGSFFLSADMLLKHPNE